MGCLMLPCCRRIVGACVGSLVVVLCASSWGANGASACACGDPGGVVVAHGKSLYGVPWRIQAKLISPRTSNSRAVEIHFSIGKKDDYKDVGYFTGLRLPLHPAFVFTANAGSEVDEFPESDLSGVTRRRVSVLVVEMSNGESLKVRPSLAPSLLRKRFKWLRGLKFFDLFFSTDTTPRMITAFDSRRRRLAQAVNHRGAFD